MCVRFRSGSPAGAMRSSTWNRWTAFQGTSSSASARSICHGVRPPLTAKLKRPRAAAAARASAAMNCAARRAADAESGRTTTFKVPPLRRQPPDDFSTCPPNWKRIAESSLFWNSASPREAEALVERRREDWRRHGFVDRRLDRPAPLARIGDAAREIRERADRRSAPSRSGRAATRRSRCRAATVRRCRRRSRSYW